MAEKRLRSDLLVATKTFLTADGQFVRRGDTAVAGHPILRGHTSNFKPLVPKFSLPVEPEPGPEPAQAAKAAEEPPEGTS
jgi:hypothetical protein